MPTDDLIMHLFCIVADTITDDNKRRNARLYPREILTVGLVFTLKGGTFRAFYRWLTANHGHLFPGLPERTRLLRLLRDYSELGEDFLATPTFFTAIDTYGIELIHPRREGRSPRQVGRTGQSNGRWIVGMKRAWLVDTAGRVVNWMWDTANVPDQAFRDLAFCYDGATIVLADLGFRATNAPPRNLQYGRRGTWNERDVIENCCGFLTGVCHAKKMFHRVASHWSARLWYAAVLLNCLLTITEGRIALAQFSI